MRLDYGDKNSALITLFTQEMLKRGYLAASSVYVSYSHTEEIVKVYLKHVDSVFCLLKECIKRDDTLLRLNTRIKEDGFKRLTDV